MCAAIAAHMPLVLVRHGYARGFDLDQAGALAVVDDMRQLHTLLQAPDPAAAAH